MRLSKRAASLVLGMLLAGCGGSGPELAEVTGVVKLDGAPLADATIEFIPQQGRPASALSDASGQYRLQYNASRTGAPPGDYVVRITTYRRADPDNGQAAAPEKIPTKFNRKSELKKTVQSGKNEINLDVESKGQIVQPAAD